MYTKQPHAGRAASCILADLKACCKTRNIKKGKELHAEVVESGHNANVRVVNALIHMYAKCGSMVDARQLFEGMQKPNLESWNGLILGYATNGEGSIALDMFFMLRIRDCVLDSITIVASLKACTCLALKGGLERGKALHSFILRYGFDYNIFVQNTLIDMYAKCGAIVVAHQVFDGMQNPDLVSWNILIMGYVENGQSIGALDLFTKMSDGPDYITFIAALKACSSIAAKEVQQRTKWLTRGKEIHALAVENAYGSNIKVANTLIDMYANCGSMVEAHRVFASIKRPDVVSWTALILGYSNDGQGLRALELFSRMRREGCPPNSVTLVAALKACTSLVVNGDAWKECREKVAEIHNSALEIGCGSNIFLQNTLIDMYSKCGRMVFARNVFESMNFHDAVSWNVLILGYVDNEQPLVAMELFLRMRKEGPSPDWLTFAAVFKVCASLGALQFGKTLHCEIQQTTQMNVVLLNSLVDFYAKCGSLVEAHSVFHSYAKTRDLVTWNALLGGFASIGDHVNVFSLFNALRDENLQPDSITFLCVLKCCSHAGLVREGKECYDTMSLNYKIVPSVEHCTCMIDMFGRANQLDNAMALVQHIPCTPNDVTWVTILAACHHWKNVEVGKLAFETLIVTFEVRESAAYVLMGQIYGSRSMLQEQIVVMGLWKKLKEKPVKKH